MQDQIFWQSRSPIAILDGKAKKGNSDVIMEVYLVLKNTGKYPIELFAIAPESGQSPSIWEESPGVYRCDRFTVASFSQECLYEKAYYVFISPPRGNGWNDYIPKNILNPGEEIYIGYQGYNYPENEYGTISSENCWNSNKLVLPYLKIFYKEKIGNLQIFKQQYENHKLILPCEE
jgi:hypothetical protein